jgi:hypothetical protein
MSDAIENADEGLETGADTAAPAPAGADAPQDSDPLASVETAARAGGWVPKDEWKGDPEKWVDAPGFVLKAAEILPHVNQALREAKSEIRDVKKTLASFAEHHNKTEQRAYERAFREIQDRIDASASVGDVQGVRNATDELIELQKDVAKPAAAQSGASPEFSAWQDENAWYGKDKPLSAAFDALCKEVFDDGYTTPKAGLKEAMSRLKADYPHKFENPARKQAPPVEGGGAPPRARGKGYADLPPDAKAMCDDFVKRIPGFKRETYVKDFFGS